jgi:endonuclease/exonuclease/phosphatase family metal-dependent hydrolase
MQRWYWVAGLGVAIVGYVMAVAVANRLAMPSAGPLVITRAGDLPAAQNSLTVLNWNLGYAGLGKESEFAADGGKSLRAPSRASVDKNLAGIKRVLADQKADVYTLQEITISSPLNYGARMWDEVQALMPTTDRLYVLDVDAKLVPPPLRLEHGLATLSNVRIARAESVPLPTERGYWFGFLKKLYVLVVARLPIAGSAGEWVVVNLHHAAYDSGGTTRQEQVMAVVAFGRREFEKGNYVVLSGDWNMLLFDKKFPHHTDPRHLGWVQPFPREMIPSGWQLVSDSEVPTVRQLDRPYERGQNFVTMIDGFLVSPNVAVDSVRVLDLEFAYSDHQPVFARFRTR